MHELPAPAAPPATAPEIADVPATPPTAGAGRLLIASEGEPAKVSLVTETWEGVAVEPGARRRYATYPVLNARKTELVCMAPCAVDLPTGAHALVFTSLANPERTSTAEIAVPQGTTVVRHAIGTDKPYTPAYLAGFGAATGGTMLTLAGSFMLGMGLSVGPTDTTGQKSPRDTLVTAGAVVGTVGLVALVTGIVVMIRNQPERGPGTTTTFRLP